MATYNLGNYFGTLKDTYLHHKPGGGNMLQLLGIPNMALCLPYNSYVSNAVNLVRSRVLREARCKFNNAGFTLSNSRDVTAAVNSDINALRATIGSDSLGMCSDALGSQATICCDQSWARILKIVTTDDMESSGKCDNMPAKRNPTREKPCSSTTPRITAA